MHCEGFYILFSFGLSEQHFCLAKMAPDFSEKTVQVVIQLWAQSLGQAFLHIRLAALHILFNFQNAGTGD